MGQRLTITAGPFLSFGRTLFPLAVRDFAPKGNS
jgi:hypothetical protein